MKSRSFLLVAILLVAFNRIDAQKIIAVVGSSTSSCSGQTLTPDSCYISRLRAYYDKQLPSDTFVNNDYANGGYSIYRGMPTSYVSPYADPSLQPDTMKNITAALKIRPSAVLINYPTNGYDVFTVSEVMFCFRTIRDAALQAGVPCYITTTQPRSSAPFNTSAARAKLAVLKDSILAAFGDFAIDFYTGLFNPADSSLRYDAGDGANMNNTGHDSLFRRVLRKNIFVSSLPSCAVNTLPSNGATISTQNTASLSWNPVSSATSYDVFVWQGTTLPTTATARVSTTSYAPTGLTAGTTYTWFVVPNNASGAATGCGATNTSTFITAASNSPLPACVNNTAPTNNSVLASEIIAGLQWNASATATSYDVYLWTGATVPTVPVRNVTGTRFDTIGLNPGITYKFFIAPRNANGIATGCAASNTSSFTTAAIPVVPFALPNCVTATAPVNNSTLATKTTATLSWNTGRSKIKKLVIIGSSTSACLHLDPETECYTGRLRSYYNQVAPQDTLVDNSLAIAGTNIYNGMPSSFANLYPAKGNLYAPLTGSNITAALKLNPDAILVNYPNNSYDTLSIAEIMYCLRTIRDSANIRGVPCFITTTQPRANAPEFAGSAVKLKLAILKDSILAAFGNYAIDFYTGLINPADSSILYDQGDHVHMNPTGHTILFQRVMAKNVFSVSNNPSAITSYDLFMWTGAAAPASATLNTTDTSYAASGLTPGTTYKFYASPKSSSGTATGCAAANTFTFTTASDGALPACVINTSPANAATLASQTSARLTWNTVAGATSYDVYLAAGNAVPTVLVSNTTDSSFYATTLTAGTLYSWYIAPHNASGINNSCGATNRTTFTTAVATGGGNIPPVPNAGAPVSITLPTSTVTLNGGGSYDPDGRIAEYYWYQTQGPATATIGNFNAYPVISGLTVAGTYGFGLQVKDNNGQPNWASVVVTVNPAGTITVPACATNTSPASGAVLSTQNTASLVWNASASATSYDVYIWTGATAPSSPTATVSSTSYGATGLQALTSYNWYVVPKNTKGSATGCASNATTFTTAGPVPSCTPNLSPATGTTLGTANTASLSWTAAATAVSYDLYLWTGATAPSSATVSGISGTSYSATGLTGSSTYSWYVVPRNASGAATGCASNATTFNTAAVPAPVCTTNSSPASGSTIATATTATLVWNAATNASSYDVYIWTGATAPTSATATVTGATTYNATSLTAVTTYSWYVVPKNGAGAPTGCATSASTFTTSTSIPVCISNTSPANGAILPSQTSARIVWPASSGASSYDVYLAAGNAVPTVLVANTTDPNYYAAGLTAGTLYSWYVAPRNANGVNTACGAANRTTFTTAAATGGGNIAPVPNAGSALSITLPTSTVTLNGGASYDPDGRITEFYWYQTQGPVTATIGNFTAYPVISGLTTAGTYGFGLQVKDNNGVPNWSSVVVTVNPAGTGSTPSCTPNLSPATGSTIGTATSASLSWTAAATATSYDLYLWTGATAPSSATVSGIAGTSYNATGLTGSSVYSWYVVPRNASGAATGCSTNASTFATAAVPAPVCTSNSSPASGSTIGTTTTANLVWNAASNASSYDVYLWTGAAAPSSPTTNVTTTSYNAGGLTALTTYNWYVVPKNAAGTATGCSGSATTFTTADASATPGTGLQGVYYNGISLSGTPLLTRIDPTIDLSLTYSTVLSPAKGVVPDDYFSIRWSGQVKAVYSETYTFYTLSDDGIRLWVNGVQLVDNWVNQGPTERSGTINLVAGQKYDIQIEYYENTGESTAKLSWSSPSTAKAVVPQSNLYPPTAAQRVAANDLFSNDLGTVKQPGWLPGITATLAPNPVKPMYPAKLFISSNQPGSAIMSITSSNGVPLGIQKIQLQRGITPVTINTAGITQGLYFISIATGTSNTVKLKMVVD